MAESQLVDPVDPTRSKDDESEGEEDDQDEAQPTVREETLTEHTDPGEAPTKKKKKSKKSKLSAALSGKKESDTDAPQPAGSKMTPAMMETLLEMNPSLKGELASMDKNKAAEMLKKMDISALLTGMSIGEKNKKDMGSFKFWQTQPVPKFDEKGEEKDKEGPIKEVIPEKVPKEPAPLPESYEWCELDLTNDEEISEVYNLLTYHYVEDDNAQFRFNYSRSFLNWALKSPHWKKSWHIGVRASKSRRLVATIFGIPTSLRIRSHIVPVVEINYLCIHKQLRAKRLTPVLIKEITRRCHLEGIYQAIYTAGVVLPTPVTSCRYFHRSLDWLKLHEVGFSGLPPGTTKARMVSRHQLPANTSTPGLRPMKTEDIDSVLDLLSRYLKRFLLAQEFTRDEIEHWLIDKTKTPDDRVVWAYVVEGEDGKITDMMSFYCLESSVIKNDKHGNLRAAYLFYYASETAFNDNEKGLKERLQSLIGDALVEAKKVKFDVFNALTLHDNPLFLENLKFGAGDGQLHYYLYNWRTPTVPGGVDQRNMPDEKQRGGIGMVLL